MLVQLALAMASSMSLRTSNSGEGSEYRTASPLLATTGVRAVWCSPSRMQRGRPCHSACMAEEPEKFVSHRRLTHVITSTDPAISPKTGRSSRRRTMPLVETADSKRSFVRFDNLPPQIKVKVCECYVAGPLKDLRELKMPSSARVCPELLGITLFSFYQIRSSFWDTAPIHFASRRRLLKAVRYIDSPEVPEASGRSLFRRPHSSSVFAESADHSGHGTIDKA